VITTSTGEWTTAPLVALDLEGSGPQDGDNEAILEIAVVPITAGRPDTASAYTTLINPGRAIPRKPWISPGLTTAVLATAPIPAEVEPELARRINGHVIVGHNVGVDWRLLHRRHPAITPTALVDTLRLARHLKLGTKNSLSALTDQLGLTPQIERLAPGGQPHRALWDTIATALLLSALVARAWPASATIADLLGIAAIDPAAPSQARPRKPAAQESLFDPATWLAAPGTTDASDPT
jgi:DNA polymerase III epsilon subunit-like protein